MPRKRNNSWSRCQKEKKIITARLIEISLKVDGYVYNQKPISAADAEQYIKEVTSYKTICGRDERSLQVIEKLTRCMKAIIIEHQELRNDTYCTSYGRSLTVYDNRTGTISPVYSISDDDRTQLTQYAEERAYDVTEARALDVTEARAFDAIDARAYDITKARACDLTEARANDVTEAAKEIETMDLSNIDDDNEDICNVRTDSLAASYAGSRINVQVDIHKAISDLSLTRVEDVPITPTDANSQSILDNFEGIDKKQYNGKKITYEGASGIVGNISYKVKTINILKRGKGITDVNNIDNLTTNIKNNKPVVIVEANETLNSSNIPNIFNIQKDIKFNMIDKKIYSNSNRAQNAAPIKIIHPTTQSQTMYDSNRTCSINNSIQKEIHVTQPAKLNKVGNSNPNTAYLNLDVPNKTVLQPKNTNTAKGLTNNKPGNNAVSVNEKSNTTNKKRGPRKKKIDQEKNPKTNNKRVYRKPKLVDNKSMTNVAEDQMLIYNTNVENDLSWMENIRYVREIRVDENDPKLDLEESFWDNYYLPANWTDNEFL